MRHDDWYPWTDAYLTRMRNLKRSAGTIRLHRHYLNHLAARLDDPATATDAKLVELLGHPTWGPDAACSARMVWRGFYKWAHGTGLMPMWVGEAIPPITKPHRLPRPSPDGVVDEAVESPDRRDALMAMLAAFCGLRAAEIAQVRPDRDLFGEDILMVHGKGKKERLVPIEHPALLAELQRLKRRGGWAFPSTDPSRHLTPGYVSKLMSRAIPGEDTAHNFRHSYATNALEESDDIVAVAALLGHAQLSTTQIYTKVSVRKLRRAARGGSRQPAAA